MTGRIIIAGFRLQVWYLFNFCFFFFFGGGAGGVSMFCCQSVVVLYHSQWPIFIIFNFMLIVLHVSDTIPNTFADIYFIKRNTILRISLSFNCFFKLSIVHVACLLVSSIILFCFIDIS